MASCGAVLGLIFLVVTDLAIVISFATPFWTETRVANKGIWAFCNDLTGCMWTFENDFYVQDRLPDWFKAVQGLMTIGLCVGLFALLIATISLCCQCKSCNPNNFIAGLLILGFLIIGVAVIVFGIKSHEESNTEIDWGTLGLGSRFGWSFWLAVSSAACCLFTSLIYACQSKYYYD